MTTIHTDIPNEVLPTALTDPNKIVTEYESYTLIPRLGPLSYAYIKKAARQRLWYINQTLVLLDLVAVHKATWKVKPDLPLLTLNAVIATGRSLPSVRSPDPVLRLHVPSREERIAVGPRVLLDTVRRLPSPTVELSANAAIATTPASVLRENLEAESDRDILVALREPNPVIDRLVEDGKLLDDEGSIRDELIDLNAAGQLSAILDAVPPATAQPSSFVNEVSKTVANSALETDRSLVELSNVVKANGSLDAKVVASIADVIGQLDILIGVAAFDDAPIVDSREWAFLRRERVELLLEPPRFRGPFPSTRLHPTVS